MRCVHVLLAGTFVAASAGCGGGYSSGSSPRTGSSTPSAAAAPAVRAVAVQESEFSLTPSSIHVAAPGPVTFRAVNKGSLTHALSVKGQGVAARSADLAPGDSTTLKVTLKAGTYTLYCPIGNHRAQGMEAKLVVGSATAGGMTTHQETKTKTSGGYGY